MMISRREITPPEEVRVSREAMQRVWVKPNLASQGAREVELPEIVICASRRHITDEERRGGTY
jgi:hypothetical protein